MCRYRTNYKAIRRQEGRGAANVPGGEGISKGMRGKEGRGACDVLDREGILETRRARDEEGKTRVGHVTRCLVGLQLV